MCIFAHFAYFCFFHSDLVMISYQNEYKYEQIYKTLVQKAHHNICD